MWTDDRVIHLADRVSSGAYTFAQIGEDMDITKNAAIGKARRLGLSGPRSRGGIAHLTFDQRLERLASFPNGACCIFPIGEPGKAGFGFCGELTDGEHSYCRLHQALTHVRGSAN